MKISFLVTYYNQKDFVRQSLDSILAIQKPCDWEILVGDDGSNDGTTDVVQEYMEQYPEHIFLYVMDREPGKKYEIVRRSSANRLNLVAHMTGDFFCCLDGDDRYCHTDFITKALDIFDQHKNVSAVAFGYQMYSNTAGILSSHTLPQGLLDTAVYLAQGMYTHAGACVFKNFMSSERNAFLNDVAYFDDNNIVTNNLYFGHLYGVPQVVYSYLQTDNSTYNSMQFAERAVLNAQSFDVDILLLPQQEKPLLTRYSTSLLQTRFLSRKLKKLLGEDKWGLYFAGCSKLKNSVTLALLTPSQRSLKIQAHKTIMGIIKAHPKTALREFLRCCKYCVH